VFQETVEKTAGTHLLRDRRHRFANNFRLAIPAGLPGQAQIAQAKPGVFGPAGAGGICLRARRHAGCLRPAEIARYHLSVCPKPYEIAQAGPEKRRHSDRASELHQGSSLAASV
jgi:hypothetical protein